MAKLGSPPCCEAGSMTASVRLASLRQPTRHAQPLDGVPTAPRRLFWSALLPPEASAAGCQCYGRARADYWKRGHGRRGTPPWGPPEHGSLRLRKPELRPNVAVAAARFAQTTPWSRVINVAECSSTPQHARQAARECALQRRPSAAENRGRARWPLRLVKARPRARSPRPDSTKRSARKG